MHPFHTLIAHVDGAARGNPGPAGIGVYLTTPEGAVAKEIAEPLGETTNNVAEYSALIKGLQEALALGCNSLRVITDSELMARQINGIYRVKTPHLVPLYQKAIALMKQFEKATIEHTRRENNKDADRLSNIGADLVKVKENKSPKASLFE